MSHRSRSFWFVITTVAMSIFALGCPPRNDNEIVMVYHEPAIRNLIHFTSDEGMEIYPRFSYDGRQILYTSDYGDSMEIWRKHIDRASAERLTYGNGEDMSVAASWTPKDAGICFSSNRVSQRFDIWHQNFAGRAYEKITKNMKNARHPSVSPNGKYVIYDEEDVRGRRKIWRVDVDGLNAADLGPGQEPRWAPDSLKIVFTDDSDQREGYTDLDIFMMSWDGSNRMRITSGNDEDHFPTFAPDGNWIAFTRFAMANYDLSRYFPEYFHTRSSFDWRMFKCDIWQINVDGTQLQQLTHSEGIDTHPDWSPDGQRIAFTSNREGDLDVWVMDLVAGVQPVRDTGARTVIQNQDQVTPALPPTQQRTYDSGTVMAKAGCTLKFYLEPNDTYTVLGSGTLDDGDSLIKYRVQHDDNYYTGIVRQSNFTEVLGSTLTIRDGAVLSIISLQQPASFRYMGDKGEFYRIDFMGRDGFIEKQCSTLNR